MIVKMLHNKGLRSEHMYMAGLASIGLTVVSWVGSMRYEPLGGVARADRWGIFVGEWAPTFFGLGLALAHYEHDELSHRDRDAVPSDLSSI
jgi:hypothetical protein